MIRDARPTDAEPVADLWNWMIRETLGTFTTDEKSAEEIAALISNRNRGFLVAEHGSDVIGFATFGAFRSGPGYAATCEHTVLVCPDAQSRGIGRNLLVCLEDRAASQGMHVMVAAISSENPRAIEFHARLGFHETGRMPQVGRKAGRWLDLVLMQKILGKHS